MCLCSWDEWLSCDKSQLKWCCYWLANLQIKMNLLSSFHSSFYWFFGSKRRKMWDKHSINMSLIQQPLALKVACCYIVCLLTVSFIVAVALFFSLAFFTLLLYILVFSTTFCYIQHSIIHSLNVERLYIWQRLDKHWNKTGMKWMKMPGTTSNHH